MLAGSPAIKAGGTLTTLATGISSTLATFPLSDLANSAAIAAGTPGSYLIQIDSEQILLTSTDGINFTATRGYNGTTPASHLAGASVIFPWIRSAGRAGPRTSAPSNTSRR